MIDLDLVKTRRGLNLGEDLVWFDFKCNLNILLGSLDSNPNNVSD